MGLRSLTLPEVMATTDNAIASDILMFANCYWYRLNESNANNLIALQVEAQDTSVIAQLGWPDMRLPLLYSLSWPHRVRMSYDQLDLAKLCEKWWRVLCAML